MPNRDELKGRVDRLLSGATNARDLDVLFLWLRHCSYGHRLVADIGHFAGHAVERDKGVAWKGAQSVVTLLLFQVPRIMTQGRAPTPPSTKEQLAEAALAALHLDPPDRVRQHVGMGKSKVVVILKSALRKVRSFDGTTLQLNESLSQGEGRILNFYTRILIGSAYFNDDQLIDELGQCLIKNKLLERQRLNDLKKLKEFVAIYAMEKMHLSRIILKDEVVTLRVGTNSLYAEQRTLQMVVQIPLQRIMPAHPVGEKSIVSGVFDTSCRIEDWCEPALLEIFQKEGLCSTPLEINEHGKLQPLF